MQLRFLQMVASDCPEFPFIAGQLISVEKPTRQMREWIKQGWLEIVRDGAATERPRLPHTERAVVS